MAGEPESNTETVTEQTPATETVVTENKPQEETQPTDLQAELLKAKEALESAQRRIGELNKESASRRKKLEELEKVQEEEKRAKMTEAEKALADAQKWQVRASEQEKKYAELEERFNEFRIGLALEREANKLGFAHPEDAIALVDISDLTIGEDGKVTGFEKRLEELAKSGRLPMREAAVGTPQPGKRPQQKPDKPDTSIQTLMQRHRL